MNGEADSLDKILTYALGEIEAQKDRQDPYPLKQCSQGGPTCLHCNQFDNFKKKILILWLKMTNPFPPLLSLKWKEKKKEVSVSISKIKMREAATQWEV